MQDPACTRFYDGHKLSKHPASSDDLVLFNFVSIRDFYIEQVKIAIGQQELLQFCGSLENLHAEQWRRHLQVVGQIPVTSPDS
jgi:hypothetical protein